MSRNTEKPGEFPYTRGIYPEMYRRRLWTIRQYAGFGTAEESNRRYKYLLEQGNTGLSVAFDLPTQMGLDSDHPLAQGEVGRVGVAISTVADMDELFEGIPLDQISTSMTINATAAIILAFYLVVARRRGIPWEKLSGTVQNDILKEFVARGTYVFPPRPSLRLVADLIEWTSKNLPSWNPISISGYHMREAGATAAQEIAFTMANAQAYIESVLARGLAIDQFAPRLSFFFAVHNNFAEEIAKFRAARRLYARVMKQRYGAGLPRSMMLRFHAQTAGSTLVAQQPNVNLIRVTMQAVMAVAGGTQSLHTNSRDEALSLPSQESARLAVRTQHIVAFESGCAVTADPFGGSQVIEALTDQLEQEAAGYLQEIERLGGTLVAIERGYIQREIQEAAYRYQLKVESGQQPIVGVNRFVDRSPPAIELFRVNPEAEVRQIQRLQAYRQNRNQEACQHALVHLQEAARDENQNLMPLILEAAEHGATLGEITSTLRQVFGSYEAWIR